MSNRGVAWIVVAVFAAIVAAVLLYFLLPRPARPHPATLQTRPGEPVNILIIGKDARAVGPTENQGRKRLKREEQSHSDVIIVCHVNPAKPSVNLVAIPRDLLVQVPGVTKAESSLDFRNMEKINHVYAIGGDKLLRLTVENLLGVKIHRSIAFDFDSFRMTFGLLRPFLGVLRVSGQPLTDRDQALMFARRRNGLLFDDADRCRNAVSLVREIALRTWWLGANRLGDVILKRLLAIVGTDTDLTRDEIDGIAAGLKRAGFGPTRISTAVLIGAGADVTLNRYGMTLSCYLPVYWEIEKQAARFLMDQDDVAALDFMTNEPFRLPAYADTSYITQALPDSLGPIPFDTAGLDSAGLSTRLLELQQLKLEKEAAALDSGR